MNSQLVMEILVKDAYRHFHVKCIIFSFVAFKKALTSKTLCRIRQGFHLNKLKVISSP